MAEKPTFNSWELTWRTYSQLVYQVACDLDPLATEPELAARVTASAAAGLLDRDSIDPLAALLAELLQNCSAPERLLAKQSLVRLGIDGDRAANVTGSNRATRVPHHTTTVSNTPNGTSSPASSRSSTFEDIRNQASALWEQQQKTLKQDSAPASQIQPEPDLSSPKPANRRSQLAARREAEARTLLEKHQQDQLSFELLLAKKRKRKFRVASLVAVLAVGAGSGQILGPRLLNRQRNQQGPLPLLVIKDLPKQWELTFATSHLPAKVLNQTAVYQRFDSIDSIDSIKSSGSSTSPDSSDNSDNSDSSDSSASPKKKRTVLVSTFREDGRFGDSSLGTPRVDPNRLDSTGLLSQAEAIASDSFPVHSLANRPVRMQWKQPIVPFIMNQQATVVHIEARGMPSSDARDFGRSLKARRDLLRNGWATPDGFTEQIVIQQREALEGIQSSLIIKSNLDGKTRVMLQMRRATKPTVPIADLQDPPERLRLPSGREVKFTREFTHNYGWIESGYEITATVFRNDSEEGTGSVTAQQTTWFYNFVEPLPDRHLDGILDLLDRVRLGNDEQWRALTAGYQASLQQLPILGELKIGDLRIVIRTLPNTGDEKPGAIRLPHVLCAYSVCVPVYKNWDGLASEADLLIDDHWWHFRQIANYDKTIPKYFASPPVDNFKTGEAKLDRVYKWWGIDFGTKATAARNANEPRLLLRPLPR